MANRFSQSISCFKIRQGGRVTKCHISTLEYKAGNNIDIYLSKIERTYNYGRIQKLSVKKVQFMM